jgi:putative MATE family efflux protein
MQSFNLTEGSIKRALKRIAIPSSIGFLFNTLFNVVDTLYVGQLSVEALAGITIAFPIFIIIIALASGIGTGGTALAAISLGEKKSLTFHQLAKNAIFLSVILALILVILMPFTLPFLFTLSGAEGLVLQFGLDYMYIIMGFAIFQILNFTLNGFLSAQGQTKPFRNFLIVGFLLNLVLDPLFIFGWFGLPALGTAGVALATVIVQMLGTLYLGYHFFRSDNFIKATFQKAKIKLAPIRDLFRQGLPVALNNATIAIGIFIIQYFIYLYGGDETIAGYGVAIRIEQIALLPTIGLNIATLAIVGQNFGAGQYKRIQETMHQAAKYAFIVLTIGIVIIYPLAPYLIGLFNRNEAVIFEGTQYLRIEGLAIYTYSLIGIATSTLQSMKKPYTALFIGLIRQLSPILIFYFMGSVLGLGVVGMWWGIVIINYAATMIIWRIVSRLLKRYLPSKISEEVKS